MASYENDLLRILIATDNHLGVWESDDVRKDDSFNTFEEILQLAVEHRADFVLLGGDLFHDNKPSRNTVIKAMDILSRYCLNDNPIAFQILSDQTQNFTTGRVNFENPNLNVGLPVFTIHGNHDDPTGSDNLSAVDILATGALVNYFGKAVISGTEGAGKVRIAPVLLRKGNTHLAMYGLGNIRDERLCRLFSTPNSVEWMRPAATAGCHPDDWFSLFVLHQNRVAHTQNSKNSVREGHLAKFLDLVVWGHEHECIPEAWETTGGGSFSVMQPGSSVATALSEGESRPKQATLVEIVGSDWRTIKIPLSTVRPFAFGSITLAAQQGLDHEEPKTVAEFLSKKVSEMIDSAIRNRGPKTPELPLVRLRVDYTGFSTINTQRFGQKFVGKVANPHDIILWQKAPVRRTRAALAETNNALAALRAAAAEDQVRIEDLIATHLQHNLEVLPEVELTGALREFVDKDEKRALEDTVGNALKETQAAVVQGTLAKRSRDANGDGHGASVVAIEEGQQQRGTNRQHEDNDGLDDIFEGKKGEKELARLIADVSKKRKAEAEAVAMERQRREEQQAAAEAAASHPSAVPTTSGAVSAARGRGRGQARGAAASRAATRVPVKTTAASAASKPSSFDDGRDSFEDEDEDGDDDRTTRALPPSKPRARSSRAAASAAKSKITSSMRAAGSMRHTVEPSDDDEFIEDGGDVMSVDEDDDEEEDDDDDAVQDFEESKDLAREVAALRQRSRPARKARTIGGTGAGVGTAEDPIALDMTDDEDGADLLDSQPSKIYSTTIGRGATTQPTGRTKGASQMKWGALK